MKVTGCEHRLTVHSTLCVGLQERLWPAFPQTCLIVTRPLAFVSSDVRSCIIFGCCLTRGTLQLSWSLRKRTFASAVCPSWT